MEGDDLESEVVGGTIFSETRVAEGNVEVCMSSCGEAKRPSTIAFLNSILCLVLIN